MEYLKLEEYRCEVCKILKNYFAKKKAYQFIPQKSYYSTKNCCDGIDEELIGKCVHRIIKSDKKFEEGRSKLDLRKFRRMHVIYEARSYIQQCMKFQNKYLPYYDYNFVSYMGDPAKKFQDKDETSRMIKIVKESKMEPKSKHYILELLGGKALIDIAHENKTTRPVVQRIINEGVSMLNGR